jgi:hypothetical protein
VWLVSRLRERIEQFAFNDANHGIQRQIVQLQPEGILKLIAKGIETKERIADRDN